MYRYDEFDDTLVRERAKQFRGQVERRLKGELKEEHFKPLRLQNGVYLQLHAYMLRVAIPYGQLSAKKMRQLAYRRGQVRQGLCAFHDAPERPVQLDQAGRHAGRARRACRCRDACDPDERQLHPQCDVGSPRGRQSRRDRGSAAVVRDHPAVVDLPSGILVACRASSRSR